MAILPEAHMSGFLSIPLPLGIKFPPRTWKDKLEDFGWNMVGVISFLAFWGMGVFCWYFLLKLLFR